MLTTLIQLLRHCCCCLPEILVSSQTAFSQRARNKENEEATNSFVFCILRALLNTFSQVVDH